MPAGTCTPMLRVVRTRPCPMQEAHGLVMILPCPSQRSHGAVVIIWPSMVRTTFCRIPCPWQSGHGVGLEPSAEPVPEHCGHRINVLTRTCSVPPNTAVFSSMVMLARASRPGCIRGTGPWDPPNEPPKNELNTSPISPISKPPPNPPAFGLFGSTPESYMRRFSALPNTS